MTDVRNRGSMLDGDLRPLFLPLEVRRFCMSVNGVEETKGFPLPPRGVHATGSRVVGLRKQACIATALLNPSLSVHLLNVYLLSIIQMMGTFLSSVADLWLFHFN